MSIIKIIKSGAGMVLRHWPVLFIFYAINFISALLITLPLQNALAEVYGKSLLSVELMKQMNLQYIFEFFRIEPLVVSNLLQNFLYFAFIYGLMNIFFLGGVLSIYQNDKSIFRFSQFVPDCIRYFNQFLKLFFLRVIVISLLLLINFLIGLFFKELLIDHTNELAPFYYNLVRLIISGLLLIIITIIFEYTQIDIVLSGRISIFKAINSAIKFYNANYLKASALFGTIFSFGLILIMLSWIFSTNFPTNRNILIIALFLSQQLIVFVRLGIKLSFYASQLIFFRNEIPISPSDGL